MSKARYFSGVVKNKEFIPHSYEEKALLDHLDALEGKQCRMLISQEYGIASWQQTKYLWGVVYAMIAEEQNGENYTPEDVDAIHYEMCLKFNFEERLGVDLSTGETTMVRVPATISDHDTIRREKYIEQIRSWASNFLGLYIPNPNEVVPETLEE